MFRNEDCPCEHGASYVGQTGRTIQAQAEEHQRYMILGQVDKSAIAEHFWQSGHHIYFTETVSGSC